MSRRQRKMQLQRYARERESHRDVTLSSGSRSGALGAPSTSGRQDNSSAAGYVDTHPHSRYRHLYQVRRSNGDVISQVTQSICLYDCFVNYVYVLYNSL